MHARPWLIAGIGCRQGCTLAELQGLLMQALAMAGACPEDLQGIATFERRVDEPGLAALAADLGLPLAGYSAAALAPFEHLLTHRSAVSWRHTGCHGVAESAALAHCHTLHMQPGRLLLGRQCSRHATVALAAT